MAYNENEVWRQTFGGATSGIDACERRIERSAYGNTNSQVGWQVDHIKPTSAGGTDALSNLQPLHWKSNQEKSDKTGCQRGQCCR
jgi:hypothetical protein